MISHHALAVNAMIALSGCACERQLQFEWVEYETMAEVRQECRDPNQSTRGCVWATSDRWKIIVKSVGKDER